MRNFILILALAMACVACGPRNLERPDVKIVWGMRLNALGDAAELSPNLAKLREVVMKNLLIELPLQSDRFGFPKVKIDLPQDLVGLNANYRAHIHLAFCATNQEELFPFAKPKEVKLWLDTLGMEVARNIDLLAPTRPERVIIGGNLTLLEDEKEQWTAFLDHLRTSYPDISFSIGGRTDFLEKSGLAAVSSEIAVDYPPISGLQLKSESRAENQHIAALATQFSKPVFIYRANIIGEDALLQLKNRMRFWPEEVAISGLCINTLYPKIALRDDHTYYGLQKKSDLISYLDEYRIAASK